MTDAPTKRVFDQVQHDRIQHAYMYQDSDCLIVMEQQGERGAVRIVHVTTGDGQTRRFDLGGFRPPDKALSMAADRADAMLARDNPPPNFERDLLDLQINYLQGDLSLVGLGEE